jgi:flagellar basal body rod protein FlgC
MKNWDVIVTRDTTESCTMVVEADNEQAAQDAALQRSYVDPVWEQDDTPNASKHHYVTNVEVID